MDSCGLMNLYERKKLTSTPCDEPFLCHGKRPVENVSGITQEEVRQFNIAKFGRTADRYEKIKGRWWVTKPSGEMIVIGSLSKLNKYIFNQRLGRLSDAID